MGKAEDSDQFLVLLYRRLGHQTIIKLPSPAPKLLTPPAHGTTQVGSITSDVAIHPASPWHRKTRAQQALGGPIRREHESVDGPTTTGLRAGLPANTLSAPRPNGASGELTRNALSAIMLPQPINHRGDVSLAQTQIYTTLSRSAIGPEYRGRRRRRVRFHAVLLAETGRTRLGLPNSRTFDHSKTSNRRPLDGR